MTTMYNSIFQLLFIKLATLKVIMDTCERHSKCFGLIPRGVYVISTVATTHEVSHNLARDQSFRHAMHASLPTSLRDFRLFR